MALVSRKVDVESVIPGYKRARKEAVSEVLQEALLAMISPASVGLRMGRKFIRRKPKDLLEFLAMREERAEQEGFWSYIHKELPAELRKYVTSTKAGERLHNLTGMHLARKNVAPQAKNLSEFYRPALRTKEGKVLWHPSALTHSEVILKSLKGRRSFDYSKIVGGGGLGPEGHYYEDVWGTDALWDIWKEGIKDTSGKWRP